jgi:hypothetical protein
VVDGIAREVERLDAKLLVQKLGGFPIGADLFLLGLTIVIDAVDIAALSGIVLDRIGRLPCFNLGLDHLFVFGLGLVSSFVLAVTTFKIPTICSSVASRTMMSPSSSP